VLFRDRDWHPAGAVVAALAFAFGAAAAWRIQHVGQVLSLGYFAITLACSRVRWSAARSLYGFAAGIVAGFMVLGRDQVALLGVYVLAGLVIAAIAMANSPWRALRSSLPPLLAGVARCHPGRDGPDPADRLPGAGIEPARDRSRSAPARARSTPPPC
jgi:hypothetical protein